MAKVENIHSWHSEISEAHIPTSVPEISWPGSWPGYCLLTKQQHIVTRDFELCNQMFFQSDTDLASLNFPNVRSQRDEEAEHRRFLEQCNSWVWSWWIHVIIYLFRFLEYTTPQVNLNVNHGLWVIMTCQCSFINYNKGTNCSVRCW